MKNLLYRRYERVLRQKANGGQIGGITQLAQLGVGAIDAFAKPDEYGFQSKGATIGKSVLGAAGTGAAIGSAIPGIGTGIGAGAGALYGLASGILGANKNAKAENDARSNMVIQQHMAEVSQSNAALANNPGLISGTGTTYFKNGGSMQKYTDGGAMPGIIGAPVSYGKSVGSAPRTPLNDLITSGGDAKRLSSDNALIKGNSHKEGGIQIPELDTEVEGGETTLNNYVFSKKLGFADQHLPIAKAKGIIEKKPNTPERATSMRLLADKEQRLMQSQETLKQARGLK